MPGRNTSIRASAVLDDLHPVYGERWSALIAQRLNPAAVRLVKNRSIAPIPTSTLLEATPINTIRAGEKICATAWFVTVT
jgi:hypothetical protein